MRRSWAALLLALAGCTAEPDIVAIGLSQGKTAPLAPVYRVAGSQILDPCGDAVVLRGVNEMAAYVSLDPAGDGWMSEVGQTGGNAVRFWWRAEKIVNGALEVKEVLPLDLDQLLTNAENAKLTPIPTIHREGGDWTQLQNHVTAWLDPKYLPVWKKHEATMLLNISDALGADAANPDGQHWLAGYLTAITRLRTAGLRLPLVVDAPFQGMNPAPLLDYGRTLIDTDANVILSLHMFWRATIAGLEAYSSASAVETVLAAAHDAGLPLLVTEFAMTSQDCTPGVFYDELMKSASDPLHKTGWMAWSWGAAPNPPNCPGLDMTRGGSRLDLTAWGNVAMREGDGIFSESRTQYQNNRVCPSPTIPNP